MRGWGNENFWAGIVGCVVATTAALLDSSFRADLAADPTLPTWMPSEIGVLVVSVLGGASGLLGGAFVDWVRARR